MAKVRITVVKCVVHQDLGDRYVKQGALPSHGRDMPACERMGGSLRPRASRRNRPTSRAIGPGPTSSAMWLFSFGASPPWRVGPGMSLPCCSDGIRPVSFLVERVEN